MSALYVYAVVRTSGGRSQPRPPQGIRLLGADGIAAAARPVAAAPMLDGAALREHDAVVRGLAATATAVLPVRFGATLPDEAALLAWLASARAALEPALDRVAECEQMMIRVYRHGPRGTPPPPGPGPVASAGGPGARYLLERRRAMGWEGLPAELGDLRARLLAIAVDERVERHGTPPLVATVYHLIRRGQAREYRTAVEAAAARLPEATLAVSGPWPAYAFVPEVLS